MKIALQKVFEHFQENIHAGSYFRKIQNEELQLFKNSTSTQVVSWEFSEMLRTTIWRIPEANLSVFGFYFGYLHIPLIYFHISQ